MADLFGPAVFFLQHCRMLMEQLAHSLPSVIRHCWLGGRKGIRPVKNGMVEVGIG